MNDAELDAIAQRANAATAGPWRTNQGIVFIARQCPPDENGYGEYAASYGFSVDGWFKPVAGYVPSDDAEPTAAFIASARTDVPALVAEVRQLRAVLAERDAEIARRKAAGK